MQFWPSLLYVLCVESGLESFSRQFFFKGIYGVVNMLTKRENLFNERILANAFPEFLKPCPIIPCLATACIFTHLEHAARRLYFILQFVLNDDQP